MRELTGLNKKLNFLFSGFLRSFGALNEWLHHGHFLSNASAARIYVGIQLNKIHIQALILYVSVLLLTGCEVGPDYKAPKLDLPPADAKSNTTAKEVQKFMSQKWWTVFHDISLDKLETMAIERNASIKLAIESINEARALAGVSRAELMPSVEMKGSADKTYASKNTTKPFGNSLDYLGRAGVSYEIDLFGKYRKANEAARANLLSSRAAKEVVMLTVTADVAKSYFNIRALDAKLAIARRTLQSREESYRVHKSRFRNGYCTELDCLRLEAEMASVKTTVLDLESSLEKAELALSILIGNSPREFMSKKITRGSSLEKLRIPSDVPNGIPSDLIARRPDIVEVEGKLIAANARIGEAKAAHFPSISLTSAFGFESKSLTNLFSSDSGMLKFGGGLSLPIFSGGKLSALEEVAKIRYRKALLDYTGAVKVAFREVLDSLVSRRQNREIVVSRTRQVNALKRSYSIALAQKESGLIGMLDLLDVERNLLGAEMELVGALQNNLNAVVDLCKALGGGWTKDALKLN
ncbi:RND transporter [Alphaproteobacteria bacterium]|nr:RND transporter [Alphaproteobacteria bacterium]